MMFVIDNIVKMKKDSFYIWLTDRMNTNDPNGEYDKKWIEKNQFYALQILFQWAEDCGNVANIPIWLCLAIVKLKNYIMERK